MKLSNFKQIKTIEDRKFKLSYFAEVDVTTGVFFWKKTLRRSIGRTQGGFWLFLDSSEFTPECEVERLEQAWLLNRGNAA